MMRKARPHRKPFLARLWRVFELHQKQQYLWLSDLDEFQDLLGSIVIYR